MKQGGGQQKGRRFESDTCKSLSRWVTAGERTDVFVPSPMSGGRATVQFKRGNLESALAGDINLAHTAGNVFATTFYVECKHYKDLDMRGLVCRNKGIFADFWEKCRKEASDHAKNPVMIAKQNHMPTLWAVSYWGMALCSYGYTGPSRTNSGLNLAMFPKLDMIIMRYDDVIKYHDPSKLKDPYKDYDAVPG